MTITHDQQLFTAKTAGRDRATSHSTPRNSWLLWLLLGGLAATRLLMASLAVAGWPQLLLHDGWMFWHGGDNEVYFAIARSLSLGHVPPAVYTLGYPLFLSVFVWFTNANSWVEIVPPVAFVQGFLLAPISVALIAWVSYRLSRSLKVAAISGGIYCLWPYLLYVAFQPFRSRDALRAINVSVAFWFPVLSDPLSTFLVIVSAVLIIVLLGKKEGDASDRGLTMAASALGLVTGLSVMIRIPNILMAVLALLLLLGKRSKLRTIGLFLGSLAIAFSPQMIYNTHFFGAPWRFGHVDLSFFTPEFLAENYPFFSLRYFGRVLRLYFKYWPSMIALSAVVVLATIATARRLGWLEAVFLISWPLAYTLFYAVYCCTWEDPLRLFMPVIPAFALILGLAFASGGRARTQVGSEHVGAHADVGTRR